MKTRPPKPVVGEATAIREVAAKAVPPQDTSAIDGLVEQYSRTEQARKGRDKSSGAKP